MQKQINTLTSRLESALEINNNRGMRDEQRETEDSIPGNKNEFKYGNSELPTQQNAQVPLSADNMQISYNHFLFRLPNSGWLVSPFRDLKFSGKEKDLNPLAFLRRYKNIANREKVNPADM